MHEADAFLVELEGQPQSLGENRAVVGHEPIIPRPDNEADRLRPPRVGAQERQGPLVECATFSYQEWA